ncbi:MAG TPA: condensation domain-containing protein, partial [Pilimelia sp.]|nr:condensation domain-containing protein [Pilimelia sp.]
MDVFPASYAQEGLWLLAQFAPGLPLYQVAVPLRLRLPLTWAGIEAVLAQIARRHETLRTSLELRDDALVQVIHSELSPPVERLDLSALSPAARAERLTETFYADMAEPVPVDAAPLWRVRVVRCADDDWTVIVVAHHAIFDATSIMVLRRELRELAEAAVTGRAPALPELPIQYADFAAWQRGQVTTDAYATDVRYWRDTLDGASPVHRVPTDRPRPTTATYAGGAVHFVVPPDTVRALHRTARQTGASPFMVLLAAYQALIARLSGDTDVVVGTLVAGRELPEVQPLIGMFVNTVVLRTRLSGDPPFVELVERARRTLLAAWEHQAVPFDVVVAAVAPPRQPGRNPLFQIGLNYLPAHGSAGAGAEWTSLAHEESVTQHDGPRAARFDLHLDLTEDGDRLVGILEYASDLFEAETMRAFAARFTRLLTAAVREPGTRLSRLPLLAADDRARLLAVPASPHPLDTGALAVGSLRARADVVGGDGLRLAAAELTERVAALASALAGYGASPDRPVAVLLPYGDAGLAVAVLGA